MHILLYAKAIQDIKVQNLCWLIIAKIAQEYNSPALLLGPLHTNTSVLMYGLTYTYEIGLYM